MKLCLTLGTKLYDAACARAGVSSKRATTAQQLLAADVVIADLTSDDPFVRYGLGIAHGLGKPAVVLEGVVEAEALAGLIGDALAGRIAGPFRQPSLPFTLPDTIRIYLATHEIFEVADLARLDLDDLGRTNGVSRQALRAFMKELAASSLFPDDERLREFLVRRGIFV
jgi:hypothetical protein